MPSNPETAPTRTTLLLGRATAELAALSDALSDAGLEILSIRPDELPDPDTSKHAALLACQDDGEFAPDLRSRLMHWSQGMPVMIIEASQLRADRRMAWNRPDGLVDRIVRHQGSDAGEPKPAISRPGLSIWVLAASIGGPEALRQFLGGLIRPVDEALVLVQHIGKEFVRQLVTQLDQITDLPVRLMQTGDLISPGVVHVIPGSERLSVDRMGQVTLSEQNRVPRFTPCIDDTVAALNEAFAGQLNMMIFSGMSNDGVASAEQVVGSGGEVWIQEPSSCVVSSMVDGVAATLDATYIGTPEALASRFSQRHHLSQQEWIKNGTHRS